MSESSLVGRIGTVFARVRGGERAGEVRVVVNGVPHHYLAYSATALAAGTAVLVIAKRGGLAVEVEPWFEDDPASGTPPAGTD